MEDEDPDGELDANTSEGGAEAVDIADDVDDSQAPAALGRWMMQSRPTTIDPEALESFSKALQAHNVWASAGLSDVLSATQESIRRMLESSSGQAIREISASISDSLWKSRAFRAYERPESAPTTYSRELSSAADYFDRDDAEIGSVDELNRAIAMLISKVPELSLVWRGHQHADWGLHSQLFRHLMAVNGVKGPEVHPSGVQNYPTEDQLILAEKAVLRAAREEWRFDGMPALEIFARVQHFGGPTRLLDVTRNPYIAAWFAVERSDEHDEADARLFALATRPATRRDGTSPSEVRVLMSPDLGASYDPFWHAFDSKTARVLNNWGTGKRRWLWVPPALDNRITAQNAAFVVDGVPILTPGVQANFRKPSGGTWLKADILASSSFFAKTFKPTRKIPPSDHGFSPTFTFRILASAKDEIRDYLESRFGYSVSSIYPDFPALAMHLRKTI